MSIATFRRLGLYEIRLERASSKTRSVAHATPAKPTATAAGGAARWMWRCGVVLPTR